MFVFKQNLLKEVLWGITHDQGSCMGHALPCWLGADFVVVSAAAQ